MSSATSTPVPNQLSFLPEDYIQRRERRRSNLLCAGLFVIVLAGIGGTVLMARNSVARLEADSASVDTQYAEAARRIDMVKQLQVKQRTLANQVELTACLIDRVPRSHLLAELTNALPTGVSLLEMDMQSRVRPAPTPAPSAVTTTVTPADAAKAAAAAAAARTPKLYDVYLKVQGVAMTDVQVAAFIAHLGQSAMFKDVNLQVSEEFEVGHQKARRFAIDLQLNPEAKIGGPAISRGSKPSATGPRASTTKGGAS